MHSSPNPSYSFTARILHAFFVWVYLFMNGLSLAETPNSVKDGLATSAKDWPWWRGPERNGTAASDQTPPMHWSEEKSVVWKAPLPGRGHGSMCIVGNQIYLQTADESVGAQMIICLDRATGAERWKTTVHESGGMRKNERSTAASSTPACDGERIYVNFPNNQSLITTALDLEGKVVWQSKVSDYIEHQGYGASPALYQALVISSSDNKGGGALVAFDRVSGKTVWRHERPKQPNYPSPIILHAAGRDQLFLTGCDKVSSFDPLTGKVIWETDGATTECVTSTVTDGTRIFTSGGYPKNHMTAVQADGTSKLVWENGNRVYVPSLLIRNGYLFGTLDAGIAACWASDSGKEKWKHRLGGNFSASPVLVNDMIFATNESGDTFIYRANESTFEELGKNHLGDEVFSTPVICDSRIYYRTAFLDGDKRSEFLYCLGD